MLKVEYNLTEDDIYNHYLKLSNNTLKILLKSNTEVPNELKYEELYKKEYERC